MRKMIEKNAIDEDFRKDTYAGEKNEPENQTSDIPSASGFSFGFKKREVKAKGKKRMAETSDGEKD